MGIKKYNLLSEQEKTDLSKLEQLSLYQERYRGYILGKKPKEIDKKYLFQENTETRKGGKNFSTPEARREYSRRYYQLHKEKTKEYQRKYNLSHKKLRRRKKRKADFTCPREFVRQTFNTSDIMHTPVEKTLKILEKIINGDCNFTM